jgi:hypothetical protein
MAATTCVKCGSHGFKIASLAPVGQSYKLTLVQCASCGVPIGVLDPATGPAIERLKAQVAAIDERLARIARALSGISSE